MDYAGGCVTQMAFEPIALHMPIRKAYAWRSSEEQHNGSGTGFPLATEVDSDSQVRGGMPRTISLPNIHSDDSSLNRPDASSIGNGLMPPTPVQNAGLNAGDSCSSNISCFAAASLGRISVSKLAGGDDFANGMETEPCQWMHDCPAPRHMRLSRATYRPASMVSDESLTEALSQPRPAALSIASWTNAGTCTSGSYEDRPMQLAHTGKQRGSCEALSALSSSATVGTSLPDYLAVSSSYQSAPLQRRKQHGSTDALDLLRNSLSETLHSHPAVLTQDNSIAAQAGSADTPWSSQQGPGILEPRRRSGEWGPRTPQQLPPLAPTVPTVNRNIMGEAPAALDTDGQGTPDDKAGLLSHTPASPLNRPVVPVPRSSNSQQAGSSAVRLPSKAGLYSLLHRQRGHSVSLDYGASKWDTLDVPSSPSRSIVSVGSSSGAVALSLAQCSQQPEEQELLQRGSCAALESLGIDLGLESLASGLDTSRPVCHLAATRSAPQPLSLDSPRPPAILDPTEIGQPRTLSCRRGGARNRNRPMCHSISFDSTAFLAASSLQVPARRLTRNSRQNSAPATILSAFDDGEATMKHGHRRGSTCDLCTTSQTSSDHAHSPSPVMQHLLEASASTADRNGLPPLYQAIPESPQRPRSSRLLPEDTNPSQQLSQLTLNRPCSPVSFADVAAAADERRLVFGSCSWPHDAAVLMPFAHPVAPPISISVDDSSKHEAAAPVPTASCPIVKAVKIVPRVESDTVSEGPHSARFTVLPTILDDIAES